QGIEQSEVGAKERGARVRAIAPMKGDIGGQESRGMKKVGRRSGYWDKAKETMSRAARAKYQAAWLARLVEHAWEKAPGVRRRLDHARVKPAQIRGVDDLARLPVIRK